MTITPIFINPTANNSSNEEAWKTVFLKEDKLKEKQKQWGVGMTWEWWRPSMRKNMRTTHLHPLPCPLHHLLPLQLSILQFGHGDFFFFSNIRWLFLYICLLDIYYFFSRSIRSVIYLFKYKIHTRSLTHGCETDVIIHVQDSCFHLHKVS